MLFDGSDRNDAGGIGGHVRARGARQASPSVPDADATTRPFPLGGATLLISVAGSSAATRVS